MVFVATVTAVCACCAVVLLSFVGSAGRRPLPASFRFDATVMNAVRSWARPQWMPRWPPLHAPRFPNLILASLFSSHRCAPRSNAIVLFRRHVDTHLCDVLVSP